MGKNGTKKDPKFSPVQNGPILSLLPIVITPERNTKNGKTNGRNICQVLF